MKLAIEVDGEVHDDPEVKLYDEFRTKNLNENGLTVLRFSNTEVENDLKAVIKKIENWAEENDFAEWGPWPVETEDTAAKMKKNMYEPAEFSAPLSSRSGAGGEVKNKLTELFEQKKTGILNVYSTAGYPYLDATSAVITALQNNGADIIELGIPYSDPIADGPVIQQSNMQALENGMSIPLLFQQLKNARDNIQVPIILMGYLNPVLQFGIAEFCEAAAEAGVAGIILPDLPIHEFETEYSHFFIKHGLAFIFLITPETSEERTRKIDGLSSGFIYAVSSSSTTGKIKSIEDQQWYFKKLKEMNLRNPILAGFGIKDKNTFDAACKFTNGAIIGSAYINVLKNTDDISLTTNNFINTIKGLTGLTKT
jgi:tryptophan synthase alpha chain